MTCVGITEKYLHKNLYFEIFNCFLGSCTSLISKFPVFRNLCCIILAGDLQLWTFSSLPYNCLYFRCAFLILCVVKIGYQVVRWWCHRSNSRLCSRHNLCTKHDTKWMKSVASRTRGEVEWRAIGISLKSGHQGGNNSESAWPRC